MPYTIASHWRMELSTILTAGACICSAMASDGSLSTFIQVVKEVHRLSANFIWAYFVGHVFMAVLISGEGNL